MLDPAYLLNSGDADAEGEVEIEDAEGEPDRHDQGENAEGEPIDPLDAL